MTTDDQAIALIEEQADKSIRRVEVRGVWYFSVVDVIALLTDSAAPAQYWRDMRRRMADVEGFAETQAKCLPLKMLAADRKLRTTDAADTETLLRIIQSIPSPKAEPVKLWLAKVGAEKLQDLSPVPLGTSVAEGWRKKPAEDADNIVWAEFLEKMARLYRQQAHLESRLRFVEAASLDHEQQLESVQNRLESIEEGQRRLPVLLERLGPRRMTQEHQALVKGWVRELHNRLGWHYNVIYADLNRDFHVGTFSDILEADWELVENWFRSRLSVLRQE